MFCPNCGTEDQSHNQFCRSCGTSLHAVRSALDQPDDITNSAITAREEIGRAIAGKSAEFKSIQDLRTAVYEVLPAIERFLQSPEERRLYEQERRLNQIRGGMITSVVGLALILSFLLVSWVSSEEVVLIGSAVGLLVLLIGVGVLATALWLTVLPKRLAASSDQASKRIIPVEKLASFSNKELAPGKPSGFHSVTEGTTRDL
jgi:hypothetical protein